MYEKIYFSNAAYSCHVLCYILYKGRILRAGDLRCKNRYDRNEHWR